MEYITFEDYKSIGGVLEPAAFDRYSLRVFSRIRKETCGRVDVMEAVPDEVKHLSRDLIEYMHYNVNSGKAVASESQSQGGASESISYVNKTSADTEKDIDRMIYDYLASVVDDKGVPLLYRGCL